MIEARGFYGRVRHVVLIDGMSRREAARIFGIYRRTVEEMLRFSIPPGYRRDKEIMRPKLVAYTRIIDISDYQSRKPASLLRPPKTPDIKYHNATMLEALSH